MGTERSVRKGNVLGHVLELSVWMDRFVLREFVGRVNVEKLYVRKDLIVIMVNVLSMRSSAAIKVI